MNLAKHRIHRQFGPIQFTESKTAGGSVLGAVLYKVGQFLIENGQFLTRLSDSEARRNAVMRQRP